MKVSYATLQNYFEKPLPPLNDVADAFTFHAFEIDGIEGEVLDIKVLPNRAGDCGSELGIARELSAILDAPLKTEFATSMPGTTQVQTSLAEINATLGTDFSSDEVEDVFRRLNFQFESRDGAYTVTPPAERLDLTIPVDIAEEVGQILGYDRVLGIELPPMTTAPDQERFQGIERMKDQLVEQGFIEVSTQSFAKKGDIELANPFDKTKPFLRTSLEENLKDSLDRAKQYATVLFPPNFKPKLFEVGTVFPKAGEYLELRMTEGVKEWGENAPTVDNLSVANMEEYGKDYVPKKYILGAYNPFSLYPSITRDIAGWAPSGTGQESMQALIQENAGELLLRIDMFDSFTKGDRTSYAFRLVFQSMERTLTDAELNPLMEAVTSALTAKGYEIR